MEPNPELNPISQPQTEAANTPEEVFDFANAPSRKTSSDPFMVVEDSLLEELIFIDSRLEKIENNKRGVERREQLQGNELALGIFEMTQTLRRVQEPILSGEELILLAFRGIIIRVAGRFAQKTGYQLNLNPHKKSIT